MKRLSGLLFLSLLLITSFYTHALATNGNQFIGVGSYAKGMGGAVTAAPFDTTTAISNPAGLTKIGARADFHFELFQPDRKLDFTGIPAAKGEPGGDSTGGSKRYLAPAVGWSAPVNDDETLFFGGGMFIVSGMGTDHDVIDSTYWQASTGGFGPMHSGKVYTQYQFWKLAPTLAKKFDNDLSIGISLNIDYQQMSYKQWFINKDTTTYGAPYLPEMGVDLSAPEGAMGWGVTIGGLYEATDQLTIGATYISKQSFEDMKYRLQGATFSSGGAVTDSGDFAYSNSDDGLLYLSQNGTYSWSGMDFPQQIAVGLAYRPEQVKGLTITLDYKWINFSDTYDVQHLNGTFTTVNTTTSAVSTANSFPFHFGWSDVHVWAIGAQLEFGDSGFLRVGYNHGDSPIKADDVLNNMAFPAIVEDHFSFGGTKNLGKNWQVHFNYMYASKNALTESAAAKPPVRITLDETSVIMGISYRFL